MVTACMSCNGRKGEGARDVNCTNALAVSGCTSLNVLSGLLAGDSSLKQLGWTLRRPPRVLSQRGCHCCTRTSAVGVSMIRVFSTLSSCLSHVMVCPIPTSHEGSTSEDVLGP